MRDGDALVVAAPAKVNLFLHVVGRRDDGYHLLESLFVLLDWCDTITLTRTDDGSIERVNDVDGVPSDDDLAIRAANALKMATNCRYGASIELCKRLPQGAGLGGGSSDAASVLFALNRLWSLDLSRGALAKIGASLGADVPLFIGGQPAFVHGVGDGVTPMSFPTAWLALAIPPIQVKTRDIFRQFRLTPNRASAKINVFSEGYGQNDLEATATTRFVAIGDAISALSRASANARMTGSGGCAFAMFASEHDAHAALRSLPIGITGRVARTLARHPLDAFVSS